MLLMARPKCPRCGSTNVRSVSLSKRRPAWRCSVCHTRFVKSARPSDAPAPAIDRKMVDHELAIAADIQENLMPARLPQIPGYEIAAYYKPSLDVGGDYYDFMQADDDHLALLVADVSGKGVPGALVMVETRAYTRSLASRIVDVRRIVTDVNALLHEDIPRGMFVTMFLGILDLKRHSISCVSVGHNPMVYYRASTSTCHLVNPNGLALGIDRGPVFERVLKEKSIQLNPGDRLVVYTDGVVEAMNAAHELYTPERFYKKIKEHAALESSEFIHAIVRSVEDHQGDGPQHDDITIVTCRRLPGSP
jgi:sigma-B regulation protein RsbU (phosphoserine phosphatase)